MSQWYAACVWSRHEIDTARELAALGFLAYVPCETMDRVVMGRKRRLRRPAVPGYVFVNADETDLAKISAVEPVYAFVAATLADGSRRPAASVGPEVRSWITAQGIRWAKAQEKAKRQGVAA